MADVRLHIERLVLDGMSMGHADRARLVSAVEAELGRLLASGGVPGATRTGCAVPAVHGGTVAQPASGNAAAFGREIARAVYSGLKGGYR